MLLSLMYHHCNSDKYSNSLEILEKHFTYISNKYKTIYPEEYRKKLLNTQLCLVFDDAYFDFYYYVFPLLKKYKIKILLSVPVKYILDEINIKNETRLSLSHSKMMKNDNYKKYGYFCSWKELKEMVESGYVKIASHGYNHLPLDKLNKNELEYEIKESKKMIENKLNIECNSFVYPYGNFNDKILKIINKYYDYNFAIGGIYNYEIIKKPIYRIYADDMKKVDELFLNFNKIKYLLRAFKYKIKGLI
jgi:peptidoglycan/xylan/chitin deacetylase (PgdA/CDA1 family)